MYVSHKDRPEFEPPPQRGMLRGLGLAIVAHVLLVVALTYGLRWKHETENAVAEAELWAAVPQQAAPKEVVAPPPPPVVQAPPLPAPPVQREADIAAEREKERREAAEKRREQLEREREREQDRQRKLEAERKREEERERKEQLAKAAAEKRKDDEKKRRLQQEQAEKRLAQQREENLRRIQGLAGGAGAPSSTGAAQQASGPSASWAGRVQARVRPNIVFADDGAGNPKAEVEVRLAPDGTIVGKRVVKSSGSKAWDEAVLRALEKTETLPRDIDGRVPTQVVIEFRPRG